MACHRVDAASYALEARVGAGGDGVQVPWVAEVKGLLKIAVVDVLTPASCDSPAAPLSSCPPTVGWKWGLPLGRLGATCLPTMEVYVLAHLDCRECTASMYLRLTWKCEFGAQLGLKRLIWG